MTDPKLDMSGRKKANDLLEWVIEEPELVAHRLVALEAENEKLNKAFARSAVKVAELKAENEAYHELILEVANKHPGETRHETALRYIRERENQEQRVAMSAEQENDS